MYMHRSERCNFYHNQQVISYTSSSIQLHFIQLLKLFDLKFCSVKCSQSSHAWYYGLFIVKVLYYQVTYSILRILCLRMQCGLTIVGGP